MPATAFLTPVGRNGDHQSHQRRIGCRAVSVRERVKAANQPFDRVALGSYWLADARVAYAIRPGIELFVRGSNLLDQHYQDVFSYRTEGRAIYAGVRLNR